MQELTRILQISDIHLYRNSEDELLGLNTRQSFDAVVDMIQQDSIPIDLIVLTGDLSQDGSPEAYQYLADKLTIFKYPIYWLPGNHDTLSTMQTVFATTHLKMDREIKFSNWHAILLSSLVRGKASGLLADNELERLKQFLENSPQQNLLIMLHHQPISVGSHWLDGVGLVNSSDFQAIVEQSDRVRAVVFGHVHQAFDQWKDGVRYIAVPSTCIQFLPGNYDFALDKQNPGYQYLEFQTDGTINTTIKRLKEFHSNIDFSSKGY